MWIGLGFLNNVNFSSGFMNVGPPPFQSDVGFLNFGIGGHTGFLNLGELNTGFLNTGGDDNSGVGNSGFFNSGTTSSGLFNSGTDQSGFFGFHP
jgi:hypothetical protein